MNTQLVEKGKWQAHWTIKKWQDDSLFRNGSSPYETVEIPNNGLENVGINELWTILCNAPTTDLFDATHAFLGVGESNAGFDAAHTDLQGVTLVWVGMDPAFPTYGTSQKAVWQATFGALVANQVWAEFAVANAADGGATTGVILNRKVSAQGTKTAGQVWQLKLEISLS
jgi:hypothetical protein